MDDRTERFNTAGSYFGSTIRQSLNFVSGKSIPTYSILYLDPSKNKSRGAVENIVVPNITIGRGNRCHIRYSDEYGTVSREHASITSGEGGFYLNHNPEASNPTFINGEKISGPTLLHNGDEIQFSVNGPRLRINTNQSASGGITARLGRAIGQAVRPYKVPVWVLGVLLLDPVEERDRLGRQERDLLLLEQDRQLRRLGAGLDVERPLTGIPDRAGPQVVDGVELDGLRHRRPPRSRAAARDRRARRCRCT